MARDRNLELKLGTEISHRTGPGAAPATGPASPVLNGKGVQPSAGRRLTQDIRFDLMACHEGDFRLLKAGGSRIEWYRYGDSNPGVQTENLAS